MNRLRGLIPIAALAVWSSFAFALLAWGVRHSEFDFLVPSPEETAQQFFQALHAKRLRGAQEQLESGGPASSWAAADFRPILQALEDPKDPVEQVRRGASAIDGARAWARVDFETRHGRRPRACVELVRQNRLWKVREVDLSELDPSAPPPRFNCPS